MDRGSYKVLVKMVKEHMGSCNELCCTEGTYSIWKMGLLYCIVDASLITEMGPLLGEVPIGRIEIISHLV